MAIIYSYPNGGTAQASDLMVISRTSLPSPVTNPTYTLSVAQIAAFVQTQLQSGTPNYIPVFNTANTIIDSPMFLDDFTTPTLMTIGVFTKIQGDLEVTQTAAFFGVTDFYDETTFEEVASFQNSVLDEASVPGTAGQLLSSTGTAVRWVDPALTGVGTIGKIPLWIGTDELGDSIMTTLPGAIIEVAGDLTVQGVEVNTTFKDGSGSTGSPGQVLSSTGTETAWVGGSTGTVNGTGTTNNLPLWSDGPNGDIGDSQLRQLGPNGSGLYQLRFENADRFIINKPSSVTSGDPEYLITQDGNFKVSMGWDDDGVGFGYLYNWAGDGWRFGSAGNNPELTIVTTAGSEGVTIANDLFVDGTTTTAGDLYIERGLKDGDFTYGTAGQVLSTTGVGENVKWVDTTTGAFKEVNEGNGLGIVKQSRNPNNYAPVGNEAFDASQSTSVSSTKGAEGDYAVALGLDVYARGDHSFAFGETSRAFNDWDIVMGHDSEAVGGNSVSIGWENKAQGAVSTAMGSFATASGDNSVAIGWRINATGSESNVFGKYNATTDELFVVGNGNNSTPSDLIVGKNNGVILAPSLEINEILDPKCLVTLEYISAISSGIVGAGTIGNIPVWTTATSLGDSIINQTPSNSGVIITGDLEVSGSTQLNGTLTIEEASTFNDDATFEGAANFQSTVLDQSSGAGTAGQVLSSTGTNVQWVDDVDTKYHLTGQVSNTNEFAIALSGSDNTLDKVSLIPGTNITLTDNGSNGVTIDAGGGGNVTGTGTNLTVPMWYGASPTNNLNDSSLSFALVDPGNLNDYGLQFGGLSQATGQRNSIAIGYKNQATAEAALATGHETIAEGLHAASFNFNTVASGNKSAAFGSGSVASGTSSFAIGLGNTAATSNSFAGGLNSTANPSLNGTTAFAYGNGLNITGEDAAGFGKSNTATGKRNFVAGSNNQVSGTNSFVIGANNFVSAGTSVALGSNNNVSLPGSFAIGESNQMNNANQTAAFGYSLTSGSKQYQVVVGKYNEVNNDAIFVVGTGAASNNKKNGLEAYGDKVVLPEYGSGNVPGTPAYNLQVDSTGKIIETPVPVVPTVPTYLSAVLLLSQSGTTSPVVDVVLENSLGVSIPFNWTRVSSGEYNLNAPGKFKLFKTIVFINGGSAENNHDVAWEVIDVDNLRILTHNSDGKLTKAAIEIRTYN